LIWCLVALTEYICRMLVAISPEWAIGLRDQEWENLYFPKTKYALQLVLSCQNSIEEGTQRVYEASNKTPELQEFAEAMTEMPTPPIHPSGSTGSHLTITTEELMQLRLVALGSVTPSLIIRGGTILALHTEELLPRDVVIHGRHIAAITPWNHFPKASTVINATGEFISPGFIDAHIHVEYTKLVPGEEM